MTDDNFDDLIDRLEDLELTTVHGRITEIVGMLIKAVIPRVKIGEVCLVKREGEPLRTQVVGFTQDEVLLSPLGDMQGVGPSSEVIPTREPLNVKVGPQVLGRVLNGLGEPMDTDTKGPLESDEYRAVEHDPPDPLTREIIKDPISVGVRCLDGVLTCGKGQRIGIFAGAGVGKSTLLGMIVNDAGATEIDTRSLRDARPISRHRERNEVASKSGIGKHRRCLRR